MKKGAIITFSIDEEEVMKAKIVSSGMNKAEFIGWLHCIIDNMLREMRRQDGLS